MSSPTQEEVFDCSSRSFSFFPQLIPEIRNQIWKICTEDYPARIIDLREYREYRRPITPASPTEVTGFISRTRRPALLYVCRDSRDIARGSYTKAFGTAKHPAQTWIDFEKDILHLSRDFCREALEGSSNLRVFPHWFNGFAPQWHTGWEKPRGYFGKELNQDIEKVKDLAVSGVWNVSTYLWIRGECIESIDHIFTIAKCFVNLERFTFVDTQYLPDCPGPYLPTELVFAGELPPCNQKSPCWFGQPDGHSDSLSYRKRMFDFGYWHDDRIWGGLDPYPWFGLGILVEREKQQDSGIRPRKTGSRLATDEDRQRTQAWRPTDIRARFENRVRPLLRDGETLRLS